MPPKGLKKVAVMAYLQPIQYAGLRRAAKHSRVPMAEIIRQGVDLALEKYGFGGFVRGYKK
jgi:hypothetical protein